mmetsp:Transcript_32138/g.96296  ORF Transcript_32138/g.96296 Transcript_32138/m.96296 type:complete len:203 (+) Transcript_32138:467-1075(+)
MCKYAWYDWRMVVPSPFNTQISASNSRVQVGDSFSTTMPLLNCLRNSLLSANARHALCPDVTWAVLIRAIWADFATVFIKDPSSFGPTYTLQLEPTVSSPALTKPDTTAPTPGTLKTSSTRNSNGRFALFSCLRRLGREKSIFLRRSMPSPVTHDVSRTGARICSFPMQVDTSCSVRTAKGFLPTSGARSSLNTSSFEFLMA